MMTDLIVVAFDNDHAAFEVRDKLIRLQREHLVRLADAAVAVRRQDGHLQIKQIRDLAAEGAIGGAFWGFLAGILFWVPLLGMALGTLTGALSGSLAEHGISDDFIEEVARSIEPGQSALFLLIVDATTDRMIEQILPWKPRLIRTNLSREQERKLRQAFSEADMERHLERADATRPLEQPE